MKLTHGILAAFWIIFLASISGLVLAHVCNDVSTPGNSQYGCPDAVYPTNTQPSVNGNIINFIINVKNRRIAYYGYGCSDLGLPYCFECKNWQGVCGCNTAGWQSSFSGVTVKLNSCSPTCDLTGCPDCDFGVSVIPSSGQTIANENSKDFNINITVYNANGNYNLTFYVSSSAQFQTRQYLVQISVSGGSGGTGGDNSVCSSCSSQSCDSAQATCTSACSGATYCPGDASCYFATQASGSSASCCGDDSGEVYRQCANTGISWSCPAQNSCCDSSSKCVYSGSCYNTGSVYQLTTGADAYAYCSSGTWHSCDESSSTCSSCGFSWAGSACCGDDSGEYAKSRTCSSGCTTNSTDKACCSGSNMCVYNGVCYASSSTACVGNSVLTCNSGTWSGEDCSAKASTETDSGCSDYTAAGSVRDYTSCSGSACGYTDYSDSCSGSMLTEYCAQSSGYTSSQYNCSSGNTCAGSMYRVFSCSANRCAYADQNPDASQSYCEGCGKAWADNSCCGDDANEYYADLCPGVTGVQRKCCSNSGDKVNSLGQCTSDCIVSGTGGDNSQCGSCSSQSCDTFTGTCTGQCPGATYCSGSSCIFRTSDPGAAESCCGDDSGEYYRACTKSGTAWNCPSQNACCDSSSKCVYSGSCYSSVSVYQLTSGNDAYAYCASDGAWHSCDESSSTCSSCGFSWAGSRCCGDDSGEYEKSMNCSSGCTSNSSNTACCPSDSVCVYNGICYGNEVQATIGSSKFLCSNGAWSEINQTVNQTCSEIACSQNDKCQQCPGCDYIDYSCVGNSCKPSYLDPDSLSTYCEKCSLKWAGEGQQKNCCGDDNYEYWVSPCPNVTLVGKCCNNPSDRVNQKGECVSSCGIQIKVNITELEDKPIPMAISILPDAIEIEPGTSVEFKVYVKTTWNESLHNVSLSFCQEYGFQVDPPSIQELKPGEINYFTVNMSAPPNSTLGKKDFEVYVNADEFLNKKQQSVTLTVGKVDYTTYYIYGGLVAGIMAIMLVRKLLIHKERKGESPSSLQKSQFQKPTIQAAQPYVNRELLDYVRQEFANGASEDSVRIALLSTGWKKQDIEAAMKEARK